MKRTLSVLKTGKATDVTNKIKYKTERYFPKILQ